MADLLKFAQEHLQRAQLAEQVTFTGESLESLNALCEAYADLLASREGARPVAWMMELAKEIRANAEDHPKETMSRFALLWADQLAARSVTTSPTDADALAEALRKVREHAIYSRDRYAISTQARVSCDDMVKLIDEALAAHATAQPAGEGVQESARTIRDEDGHEWPVSLNIRDTKIHDDMGGPGQRIYITAGRGYKTMKYVRDDVATAQPRAAQPPAASVPDGRTDRRALELLEQLVDIWDDEENNPPEHRTYDSCAFRETMDDARTHVRLADFCDKEAAKALAAQQPDAGDARKGVK